MKRVLASFMLCCAVLAGMSSAGAASARPAAVEIKGPRGALGQLPLQVMDDGVSYIAAERLASLLKGSWVVKGKTGTLSGVSNLVGYCTSSDGHLLAFAIFTDGISVEAAHLFQDHMAITLAGSSLG